jgi:hypothetical protein
MSLLKQNVVAPFNEKDFRYTWQDFYQIEKESTYLLSEKVLAILTKLSEDVGIPANALVAENTANGGGGQQRHHSANYRINGNGGGGNRTMNTRNHIGRGNGNKSVGSNTRGISSNDEMWENMKKNGQNAFGGTKIEKGDEESIESTIQKIRISLNKMTDKNYIKQRDEIREKMKSLSVINKEMENSEEEKEGGKDEKEYKKVAKILFDIASTNKFFSKIYAQLYLELMEEFVFFQELLDSFLEGFIDKLKTIQYIDPDKDYDGYCIYIKQQDERRAMTGFLIYLAVGYLAIGEKGGQMVEKMEKIVLELMDKVIVLIDEEGSINEVEEITEILFLFFSLGEKKIIEEWKKRELWNEISEKIIYLSKQKVKEHKSLSSRALFKFLDVQKIIVD